MEVWSEAPTTEISLLQPLRAWSPKCKEVPEYEVYADEVRWKEESRSVS